MKKTVISVALLFCFIFMASSQEIEKEFIKKFFTMKAVEQGQVVGNVFLDVEQTGVNNNNNVLKIEYLGSTNANLLAFIEMNPSLSKLALGRILDFFSHYKIEDIENTSIEFKKILSFLSTKGVHPYKENDYYFLPDMSGDSYFIRSITFYKSGSIKRLNILETKYVDTIQKRVSFQPEPLKIYIYKNDRILNFYEEAKQKKYKEDDKNALNRMDFYENGRSSGIGTFPYFEFVPPDYLNCTDNVCGVNGLSFEEDGKINAVHGANKAFKLAAEIIITNPRDIYWTSYNKNNLEWYDKQGLYCFNYNVVYLGDPITFTMTKGNHTLYHLTKNDKSSDGLKWTPYTKYFEKDTQITAEVCIWIDSNGLITNY